MYYLLFDSDLNKYIVYEVVAVSIDTVLTSTLGGWRYIIFMNAAEELSKLASSTCIAQPWEDIFSGRTTRLLAACKICHHTYF